MDKPDSGIVEVILAVDLNPSNPEEPINVNDVQVHPKGEGAEGGECHMCKRILDAVAKVDPDLEMAVDGKSVEEAITALEKMASNAPEVAQVEADAFDKAMSRHSNPEPKPEPKPERKPGGGGFKKAAERAFGKTGSTNPFAEKDEEDEDEED